MGMYTELCLNVALKGNTPIEVIGVLKHMLFKRVDNIEEYIPDHPFFKTDRWDWMLQCSSHYFIPIATFELSDTNHISEQRYLTGRCDLKNYSGEIEQFIDFIMPYIDAYEGEFLGYSRYEEDTEPTLIYKTGE